MKNSIYTKWLLLLLFAPLWSIGCADDPETPAVGGSVNPDPDPETPAYYDPWIFGENMNIDVHPGNNFYEYCNGGWFKTGNLEEGSGFTTDAKNASYEKLLSLEIPLVDQIYEQVLSIDANLEASQNRLIADLTYLEEEIGWTESPEQMIRAIVEISKRGYPENLFKFSLVPENGIIKLGIAPQQDEDEEGEEGEEEALRILTRMGYQPETLEQTPNILDMIRPQTGRDYSISKLSKHPEWRKHLRSAADVTRSDANSLLIAMIDALGVDPSLVVIDEATLQALEAFNQAPLEQVKMTYIEFIAAQVSYLFNAQAFNQTLDKTNNYDTSNDYDKCFVWLAEGLLKYPISKLYADAFVTESQKILTENLCEEIRESFDKRLDHVDWIGETTRAEAKYKLAQMNVEACYPEQWLEVGPYTANGPTLLDNTLSFQKTNFEGMCSLIGEPCDNNMLNMAIIDELPIFIFNAFYASQFNAIAILPVITTEPMIDTSKPEAYNYATMAILGHEMTHGFDAEGSLFDAEGNQEDWWDPSDRAEFEARQRLLVESYSELEVVPGVYNNGEQTLCENIADLGGFLIAYDALMNKLREMGATEEELRIESRHFYQAYANLWREYNSDEAIVESYGNDEHSAPKERINGIVRNTDLWYDLFEVNADHELFLEEAERAYIW